jgi:hypothetical protein
MVGRAAGRSGRPLLGGGGRPLTAIVAALLLACAALLLLLVLGALFLLGAYDGAGCGARPRFRRSTFELCVFFPSPQFPLLDLNLFFRAFARRTFELLALQVAGDARGERGAVDGGGVVGAPRVRVPQLPREYIKDHMLGWDFPCLWSGDLRCSGFCLNACSDVLRAIST